MRNSTKAAALGAGLGMVALALVTPTLVSGNARNTAERGTFATAIATPFVATLSGANELPLPGDPDGTGAATITINRTTGEICADLRVANIDTATNAHIHRGGPTEFGDVVVPFGAFVPNPASGGCVTVAPPLAAEIADNPGGFYVNVHTAAFPGGAVRGNLAVSTTTTGDIRLLATPLRAYDSRTTSSPINPGETRTIDLGSVSTGQAANASILAVPPGATAALIRIAVTNTQGPGFLKAYSAALTSEPATAAINWDKADAIIGADAIVAVDSLGRIKLTAGLNNTGATPFIVDVVGFVY